jgi:hypothetical protein
VLATWIEPVRHWGVRIYFALPVLLASPLLIPWLLYSLYVMWRKPERRRTQGQWVGYILGTFAAVSMTWVLQQAASGAYAERLIKAVEAYKTEHGQYPGNLEQVGFKIQWGIAYVGGGSAASLFYPGPLPFSMNMYEFYKQRWTYSRD